MLNNIKGHTPNKKLNATVVQIIISSLLERSIIKLFEVTAGVSPNQIGTHNRIKNKGKIKKKIIKKNTKSGKEYDTMTDKKINLAKKIEVPGKPIVIKTTKKDIYQRFGVLYHKPATCHALLVLYRFEIYSTSRNSEVVVKLWITIR